MTALPLARSYSSLSLLAECSEKFRLKKGERLERPGKSMPMHIGSALHEAFKVIYRERFFHVDDESKRRIYTLALDALREEWDDVRPPIGSPHPWLTLGFAEERFARYIEEREAAPTVLERGEPLVEEVETRTIFEWASRHGEIVEVEGISDLPLRHGSTHFVVDHKITTGYVNSHWAKQFQVGNQLRVYAAMLSNTLGIQFQAGLINAVHVGEKALRPDKEWKNLKSSPSVLERISFTPAQLEETWEWVRGLQLQQRFHEETGFWPRNEKACGNYGGCEFLELCTAPSAMARTARMMSAYVRRPEEESE